VNPGNVLMPDDEGPPSGKSMPGWESDPGGSVERGGGDPKPSSHPTPAPDPVQIDQRSVIAALARAANYQLVGETETLSTEGLTNESVAKYFDERMPHWTEYLETEGMVRPYQVWLGGVVRAGVGKVNPIFFFYVPDTGRIGVGAKQSVSGNTNMLNSLASASACIGIEGGYSPAAQDGLNGGAEMSYNINFGVGSLSYVPDKSLSISLEFCMGKPSVGVSIGVKATRGFSETLNRSKKPEPQKLRPIEINNPG